MAASEPDTRSDPLSPEAFVPLRADLLMERLGEEIDRAGRHGTALSCLLVVIVDFEEISREHGRELPEQTLEYVAGALRRELRCFDRVGRPGGRELLIVLPGADGVRAEMVARRVLERMRAIKIESRGARRALRVTVGLSSWQKDDSAADMLVRARVATRAGRVENGAEGIEPDAPAARWQEEPGAVSDLDR